MAELLKDIYSKEFFNKFLHSFTLVKPDFDSDSFLKKIYNSDWEEKALKERMRHITVVLKDHLSDDFSKNIDVILKSIPVFLENGFKNDNLEFIFYPDFIEVYGIDNYSKSIEAIEIMTQFVSCEFAIRHFILKYEEELIPQMLIWSTHKSHSVRRLSTEGCRPRLPWAIALPNFKKDPSPILPILENLKNDPSEYVRRSVANNLNDISKDHPNTVIQIVKNWKEKNSKVDKLLKHACRTLLKQGNPEVMKLFDFGSIEFIKVDKLKILNSTIKIGDYLEFNFLIKNNNNKTVNIRLEYGIYFQKANGSLTKKVFQISEKEYKPGLQTTVKKRQSFKIITTRKYHLGKHQLAIIVNGNEVQKLNFELIV